MIRRLLTALRLRFGLRARTCAHCPRPPYGPRAAFRVARRDGLSYIEPRAAR